MSAYGISPLRGSVLPWVFPRAVLCPARSRTSAASAASVEVDVLRPLRRHRGVEPSTLLCLLRHGVDHLLMILQYVGKPAGNPPA